jgi:hypothetical protein
MADAARGVYVHQRWEELKKAPWIERPLPAGRLLGHVFWIVVMFFYGALSNYGRSFVWPFVLLIASGFFFYWRYLAILAPLMPKACPLGDKYERAVEMVAVGNAVPFVGPLTIDSENEEFIILPGQRC